MEKHFILTRGCIKPFDDEIIECMKNTALTLLIEIQGAKCAYVQSDEINILITDFDKLSTDAWFDYNIQKMTSISAAIASTTFSSLYEKTSWFDSRVFNIPKEEVINNFRWRYMDWVRNSIQMLAQSMFSHKELQKKNNSMMHEMCFQKGVNWNDLSPVYKNGTFICNESIFSTFNYDFNLMSDDDITNKFINLVLYPRESEL